jgi:hypothetical protein
VGRLNSCFWCESPIDVFEAFCSGACQGLFFVEHATSCCRADLRLAGYLREGVPAFACEECGKTILPAGAKPGPIVLGPGDPPSLAMKIHAHHLRGASI